MKENNSEGYFGVDEKREEARLNLEAEIYIEKVSKEPGDKHPGEVIKCDCVDLSANGLQVLLSDELQIEAIHTLIIDLILQNKVYRLTAEVKWVKPSKSGFLTGMYLYDSDGTAIIDWKFMLARHLN